MAAVVAVEVVLIKISIGIDLLNEHAVLVDEPHLAAVGAATSDRAWSVAQILLSFVRPQTMRNRIKFGNTRCDKSR